MKKLILTGVVVATLLTAGCSGPAGAPPIENSQIGKCDETTDGNRADEAAACPTESDEYVAEDLNVEDNAATAMAN